MLKMLDCDLYHKRLLIREDFNVPMSGDNIAHEGRILAALPTLKIALAKGASVLVLAHMGRPKVGDTSPSLAPIAKRLGALLGCTVPLVTDWNIALKPGEIALFENVRFLDGEESNAPLLAQRYAALCDVFVMDAFACAHRAQASTEGVIHYAPIVCAGPLLVNELKALNRALLAPQSPVVALIGGAKVSTKLVVLDSILDKVDTLIIGGGMANTFLAAQGYEIGRSLYEPDLLASAVNLLKKSERLNKKIILPQDVVVAVNLEGSGRVCDINAITPDVAIYDIGPKTIAHYEKILGEAKTILWNGPVGVFEVPAFEAGTRQIAHAIGHSEAYSIAGGGDTLAAIDQYQMHDQISYISTGGGAFLEFLEQKTLPSLKALKERHE